MLGMFDRHGDVCMCLTFVLGATDMDAVSTRLQDITRIFGPAESAVRQAILNIIDAEHQFFVLGQLNNGSLPSSVVNRNGQAYLQGKEVVFE
jgi:hypothetical protein